MILDEATASIDPENEAVIQRAISNLTRGKTLIVIAHRLGTVADADNIVVINEGRIAGQGRQEELLKQCPLYAQMWNTYLGTDGKGGMSRVQCSEEDLRLCGDGGGS